MRRAWGGSEAGGGVPGRARVRSTAAEVEYACICTIDGCVEIVYQEGGLTDRGRSAQLSYTAETKPELTCGVEGELVLQREVRTQRGHGCVPPCSTAVVRLFLAILVHRRAEQNRGSTAAAAGEPGRDALWC